MIKKIFLNVLPLFLLLSCGSAEETNLGNTTISGTLTNKHTDSIILSDINSQQANRIMAAAVNADGTFSLSFNSEEQGFYKLETDQSNFAIVVAKPGDKIILTGDSRNLGYTYSVEGSEESKLFREINQFSTELAKRKAFIGTKKDSIIQLYQFLLSKNNTKPFVDSLDKAMEPVFSSLDAQITPLVAEGVEKAKSFIDTHPGSVSNLVAIGLLNAESDFPYFMKVYDGLREKFPQSKNLNGFYAWIESKQKVGPGSMAPDISMNDPQGTFISLSQFRGKVVLVDFWASWCGPCRKENPNVVKVYNKYKDKGFEIFGVSLDEDKLKWEGAIAADGLTWKHGSELKGWNSSFCQIYNVQSIPYTVLLDKDGKIIATNLRGEALEKQLELLFPAN